MRRTASGLLVPDSLSGGRIAVPSMRPRMCRHPLHQGYRREAGRGTDGGVQVLDGGYPDRKAITGGGGGDPFWANVTGLWFNDGAANGTFSLIDQSVSNRTLTRGGNTQYSSAQQLNGVNTVLFDGNGDYASSTLFAGYGFGTGAYTVEAWIRPTNVSAVREIYLLDRNGTGVTDLGVYPGGNTGLWYFDDGQDSAAGAIAINTWTHVAVCRSGSTTRTWVAGAQAATGSDSRDYGSSCSLLIGIVSDLDSGPFLGNMAGFRITKAARYTTGFTPPTFPLPTSA